MAVEREPGYYWIIPAVGEPPISAYWHEGVEDCFGKKSSGYFDCSNHWREEKEVYRPYQVLGPNLPPRITPHEGFEDLLKPLTKAQRKFVEDAVAAGYVMEGSDTSGIVLDRYGIDTFAWTPLMSGIQIDPNWTARPLKPQDDGSNPRLRTLKEMYAFLDIDPGADKAP